MQSPKFFSHDAPKYRVCCCHSMKYALIWGVLELIGIGIAFVSMVIVLGTQRFNFTPENPTAGLFNDTDTWKMNPEDYMTGSIIVCTVFVVLYAISVVLMICGVKFLHWQLLIPHLVMQVISMMLGVIGIGIISSFIGYHAIHPATTNPWVPQLVFLLLAMVVNGCVFKGLISSVRYLRDVQVEQEGRLEETHPYFRRVEAIQGMDNVDLTK